MAIYEKRVYIRIVKLLLCIKEKNVPHSWDEKKIFVIFCFTRKTWTFKMNLLSTRISNDLTLDYFLLGIFYILVFQFHSIVTNFMVDDAVKLGEKTNKLVFFRFIINLLLLKHSFSSESPWFIWYFNSWTLDVQA